MSNVSKVSPPLVFSCIKQVKRLFFAEITVCFSIRVFDTCINSRISRSLENRAFFIKKMSNLPLLILRNIG